MALSTTMLESDLEFMVNDLPTTMTWNGQSLTVTRSLVDRRDDVQAEGILFEHDVEVVAVVSDFTGALPNIRDTITVDSVQYYVDTRTLSQDGVAVTFGCKRI